jgi:hypothetical protein
MELTEVMSMSAALNGISIFVNIRGMLISILSENFLTFVQVFRNWVRTMQLGDLISTIKANVQWHFIPQR